MCICYKQYCNDMVARTLDDFRMAQARHRSCRCPTEKDAPLSFTWMSSPPIDSTSPFIWQFSRTSHILRSVVVLKGSRFSLSCIFTIKYWILNIDFCLFPNQCKHENSQHENSEKPAWKLWKWALSSYLKDPSNKKGLCGTTAKCPRSSRTATLAKSMPSTKMRPLQIGTKRKSAFSILDLPAPVLPIIPT